jgi:hypothetical protein
MLFYEQLILMMIFMIMYEYRTEWYTHTHTHAHACTHTHTHIYIPWIQKLVRLTIESGISHKAQDIQMSTI